MCNVKAPAEKIRLQARAWAKAWAKVWVKAWARAWACQAQKCRAALEQYFGILKNKTVGTNLTFSIKANSRT